ncbi:hypothetical protein [Natronogracilivirga saccharolytica]|uniref:AsmA family protein n=1 Tax=Natronogracilivirga saccharolytica TaxID=2812953 RepID=A0A8J7UWM0_9BACT|nr:hypothetical protein [Natronogracilivirga saccharolytica]MBP3193772.1 hypothetical protein [Natronogracilivirga saccharolytica]
MNKAIKYVIGILGLAIIIVLVVMVRLNTIVKTGIEEIGSEMTGTAVTVDRVFISPFSGKGRVRGFRIANPEGYDHAYAFQVDNFSIELEIRSVFSNEVMVNEIVITTPAIIMEQKLIDNNINSILGNIRSVSAGESTDKRLIIEHFLLTDGSVDMYMDINRERSVHAEIATIELNDLGRGGGQEAVEDIIQRIAERLAREALQVASQRGGDEILDTLRDLID